MSEQPRTRGKEQAAPAAGRKPSRRSMQLQPQPQQQDTPSKVAVRAIHAAARDRTAMPSNSSRTSLPEREAAKQQNRGKSSAPQHEPQRRSKDSASAARDETAEPLPNSSANTERRRARRPAAGMIKDESEPRHTRSGRSNKDDARRRVESGAKEPLRQPPRSSRAKAQGRAASLADESANKQSSGRARRAPAVRENAREGSSAQQRSRPTEDCAERLNGGRQHPSKASEQSAGGTGARESRAQPKQLLTELVKQAAEFNANPVKKQSPATQPTSRAASRSAVAPRRDAKLAAPPGLEAVVPTGSRRVVAQS